MKIIIAILTIAFIAWAGYEILCGIAAVGVVAKIRKDKKKEQSAKVTKEVGDED